MRKSYFTSNRISRIACFGNQRHASGKDSRSGTYGELLIKSPRIHLMKNLQHPGQEQYGDYVACGPVPPLLLRIEETGCVNSISSL